VIGPLPPNIMLVTFSRILNTRDTFLVRFGHQYDSDEDETLSQPQNFDVLHLFHTKNVTSIVELTLTANQDLNVLKKRRLNWGEIKIQQSRTIDSTNILMMPMEIRTFVIVLSNKS
jgi:Glycosyl hydrolases family 38 C-terminal beta sandwich domain